jgi:hypothetical protein
VKQPDEDQARVYQQLRNTQVHKHLVDLREEHRDLLETSRGDVYIEIQGAVKILRELLRYIEK